MAFIKSTRQAWHDTYQTLACLAESCGGSGHKDGFSAYAGELGKVKGVIEAMDTERLRVGMYLFAPQEFETYKERNFCLQLLWLRYRSDQDCDKLFRSFLQTTKTQIMISAAVEEARHRAADRELKPRLAYAEVASRLGIDRSSFSRTWQSDYEELVLHLVSRGMDALAEIEPIVAQINHAYRDAS